MRGTGPAVSSLFLERKPGGKLPPGLEIDGGAHALRTLLAFAPTEREPLDAAS